MEKDKLLRDIELQVEFIQAHVRRILKSNGKIHALDRDILLNKTRDLYEKLLQLNEVEETKPPEKTIELPETMPAAGIPEKVDSKKHISEEKMIREEQQTESIQEKDIPVDTTSEIQEGPPYKTETEPVGKMEEGSVNKVGDLVRETPENTAQKEKSEKHETSAFDLFSSTQETIADKLGQKEESTIADKMSRHPVNDLRQIIGINEKFLFINELFKGDLSRYNKVIDDLNKIENAEGIRRYFIELKVANQWPDDMEAFLKLQELVNRKFT